jgi:hypothetical protein
MERRYLYIAIVLIVGIFLILSTSTLNNGLDRLGWVLVIASGIALLLDIIGQRRGAGR